MYVLFKRVLFKLKRPPSAKFELILVLLWHIRNLVSTRLLKALSWSSVQKIPTRENRCAKSPLPRARAVHERWRSYTVNDVRGLTHNGWRQVQGTDDTIHTRAHTRAHCFRIKPVVFKDSTSCNRPSYEHESQRLTQGFYL